MSEKSYDPETKEPMVERELHFVVMGYHHIRFTLKIPLYINQALTDSDWQEIMAPIEIHATEMVRYAVARGWVGQNLCDVITPALCFAARERTYHQFKIQQTRVAS